MLGCAPAHVLWTILVDAIVRAGAFVSVGVVDRNEEQHDVFEQAGVGFGDGDVAQQSETGVFAVRFAGVNAGLDQNNCLVLRPCGFRRERAGFRGDQQRQLASLSAMTKAAILDRRRSIREAARVGNRICIIRCFDVIGDLGVRSPFGRYRCCHCRFEKFPAKAQRRKGETTLRG